MNYAPMNNRGALETSPKVVQFGISPLGVNSDAGYSVSVKIIHDMGQYLQAAEPAVVAEAHSVDPNLRQLLVRADRSRHCTSAAWVLRLWAIRTPRLWVRHSRLRA